MVADGDKLPSGHVINIIKDEEDERLKKLFFLYKDGSIRVNPGNFIFNIHFLKFAKRIYEFEIKPSDIVLMGFPKSGTTWAQDIVWNLVYNPDLTNPEGERALDDRFPNFEGDMYLQTTGVAPPDPEGIAMQLYPIICPDKDWRDGMLLNIAGFIPSPRTLKCNISLCFLPPKMLDTCKVVYVARDPKDVLVSMFHYLRLHKLMGFVGTFDECVDCFINDQVLCSAYWSHLKLAWDQRKHPNMCLIYYEDLTSDPEGQIKIVDKFLGTKRTDEQMKNIAGHTTFSKMKNRYAKSPPTSNDGQYFNSEVVKTDGGFFRKGEVGDWKNKFSPTQVKKLNSWIAKNAAQFGDDFRYKV